jgi:hypothetical protein
MNDRRTRWTTSVDGVKGSGVLRDSPDVRVWFSEYTDGLLFGN